MCIWRGRGLWLLMLMWMAPFLGWDPVCIVEKRSWAPPCFLSSDNECYEQWHQNLITWILCHDGLYLWTRSQNKSFSNKLFCQGILLWNQEKKLSNSSIHCRPLLVGSNKHLNSHCWDVAEGPELTPYLPHANRTTKTVDIYKLSKMFLPLIVCILY